MMVYVGIVNYGSVGGVPRVQKGSNICVTSMTREIWIMMVMGTGL